MSPQLSDFASLDQFLDELTQRLSTSETRSPEVDELIVLAAERPEWLDAARGRCRLHQQLTTREAESASIRAAGADAALVSLVEQLSAHGADSLEVLHDLATIALEFSEQFPKAKAIVGNWRSPPPAGDSGTESAKTPIGIAGITTLTTVTGIATYVTTHWGTLTAGLDQYLTLWLGTSNSPLVFYGGLALAGFFGGLVYGLFTSDGEIMPKRKTVGDQRIFILGILGKAASGAAAALVGLFLSTSPSTPGAANAVPVEAAMAATRAAATSTWHLTGGALLSAFIIGMGGANYITLKRDWPALVKSVAAALDSHPDPELARQVAKSKNVKTVLEGVSKATKPPQP